MSKKEKKPNNMTVSDFARLGGLSRNKHLDQKRISEIGKKAVMMRWKKHKKKDAPQ